MQICTIPGCDEKFRARGWCRKHYYMWQRTGSPEGALVQCQGCSTTWRRTTPGSGFKLCAECRKFKAVCKQCEQVLPKANFTKSSVRCRPCAKEYRRQNPYVPTKPYRKTPEQARRSNLQRMYGISLEEYQRMFDAQGGRCMICVSPPGKKPLAVDHCHTKGEVRSLLCGNCNTGLGMFKDDIVILRRAIRYLSYHGVD